MGAPIGLADRPENFKASKSFKSSPIYATLSEHKLYLDVIYFTYL